MARWSLAASHVLSTVSAKPLRIVPRSSSARNRAAAWSADSGLNGAMVTSRKGDVYLAFVTVLAS